jgi:hypothetical protein
MKIHQRIEELQAEIDSLQEHLETEKLLEAVWLELGPYTGALSNGLRFKLQDHFGFDDSE